MKPSDENQMPPDAHSPEQGASNDIDSNTLEPQPSTAPKPPGIFAIIQSVLAAMFGVQSEEKRVQDFESGHIGSYIFVGILFVIVFIFTLIAIVNAILD